MCVVSKDYSFYSGSTLRTFRLSRLPTEPFSHAHMRNPVDRAIRTMTFGAGVVGLIVLMVFQLL
ncbi:MAG: hypothetical protein COV99_08955 [Bacteroidetes bacterium CG12_big_fil_rev_8_21_14_0_65_60_17]|nr:MAG: hypothetical protein COV99_08955 [Bacteroidetes bacterium CG12_big_fil_rev_8_21_14_0_65_60_17]